MFKKMKHMKNEKGLTLIELLAVIVILAIIAAIAIPAIGSIINNQKDKATLSEISGLVSAAKISFADSTCDKLGTSDTVPTDAAGATFVCVQSKVAIDAKKISGGKVYFDDNGVIKGIANITLTEKFKGKKAGDYALKVLGTGKAEADTTPVTDYAFSEADLNGLMGNN